jgi:hypothetical protein
MRLPTVSIGALLALTTAGSAAASPPHLTQWCINDEAPISVPYPDGWWVHPPDGSRDIAECERFGPQPFELVLDDDRVWRGESLSVGVDAGCVGSIWAAASTETRSVGGVPATRTEYLPGVGAESPLYPVMNYYAHLSASTACDDTNLFFFGWTSGGGFEPPVGDYEEVKVVLDAMVAGVQFTSTPDTAMEPPHGTPLATLLGAGLLTLAILLGLRNQRRIG